MCVGKKVFTICILFFHVFFTMISCEKKNDVLEAKSEFLLMSEESGISEIDVPVESFLVYAQTGLERGLHISTPISIYVTVKNNDIIGYSLRDTIAGFTSRNNELITFSSIELTIQDFYTFKNALEKAIEWDSLARQNNVDIFIKEIPISISAKNVSWITFKDFAKHTLMKGDTLKLNFFVEWNPSLIDSAKGQLHISSDTILSSDSNIFSFSKGDMGIDEIKLFLNNVTDERIQDAIVVGRIKQKEDEEKKVLTETLFN